MNFSTGVPLPLETVTRHVFLEDTWLGDKPLGSQYPTLYTIARRKEVTVASVLGQAPPLNLAFRKGLNKRNRWIHLVTRLMEVQLTDEHDVFKWDLTVSGKFAVKSLYSDFMSTHGN